jgi:sugar O-acyltransferase (sialic acid O-acetyltransferase NeuD family)
MKIVIFGGRGFASLAWFLLTHDSPHEVVGFTVDSAYLESDVLHGLPVVAFEQVEKYFPPESIGMIAPVGMRNLNGLRQEKHRAGKAKGYRFISFVSSRALTWPDLTIGENCMLCEGSVLQPFATLGDGVTLRAGANVSHHVTIGDNCFIAANSCIGGGVRMGERCGVGLNATIREGITIAPRCFIAAGAVVTADTEENGIYVGVPAKRRSDPADSMTTL